MQLKEISEKSEKLSFFISFVDISKIRILQLLNEETKKLENINKLKFANSNLLNAIEERWFVKKGMSLFDRGQKKSQIDSTVYFLVDPKKIDIYSSNMLKKLEESLLSEITPNDYVVTFGSNVNIICQKNELNVIEHFDYSSFEELEELSEQVSSLIEVGLKNNLFNKAVMMVAQSSSSHSEPFVLQQILPLQNINEKQSAEFKSEEIKNDQKLATISNNQLFNHKKIVSEINIGKAQWNPDIYIVYEQLSKTIIKQSIYETKIIANIEQYYLELQLLEEKRNKLVEQRQDLVLLFNRTRKEESTMQSLLLYSSFKLREEEEEFPLVKIKAVK